MRKPALNQRIFHRQTGQLGVVDYVPTSDTAIRVRWDAGAAAWPRLTEIDWIDWNEPLELNDGTAVVSFGLTGQYHQRVSIPDKHPANPARVSYADARRDDGLILSNHNYRVRNRIMKNVDTGKPLQIVATNATTRDMKFVTRTEEHHILVMPAKASEASFNWAIFTSEGDFVSSSDTSGAGLKLRNKAVVTTETVDIHLLQGVAKVEITCTDGTPTSARLV